MFMMKVTRRATRSVYDRTKPGCFISLIHVFYQDDDRPNLLSFYLLDESVCARQSNDAEAEKTAFADL